MEIAALCLGRHLFESTRRCVGGAGSDPQSSSARRSLCRMFFCFFFPRPKSFSNSSQGDSIKSWQSLALTQPNKASSAFTCLSSTV